MRFKFLIVGFCICFIFCTNKNSENKSTGLKTKAIDKNVDSLFGLVSFNTSKETKLLMISDTLIFLDDGGLKTGNSSHLTLFYYNSILNQFEFDNTDQNRIIDTPYDHESLNQKTIVDFGKLANGNFSYHKIPAEVIKIFDSSNENQGNLKSSMFQGKYYLVRNSSAKSVAIYDPESKKLKDFHIDKRLPEVRDFFVYDVDKDNNPEIFIFYVGSVPRSEIYSYAIYSLRKDSVHVNYK